MCMLVWTLLNKKTDRTVWVMHIISDHCVSHHLTASAYISWYLIAWVLLARRCAHVNVHVPMCKELPDCCNYAKN